MVSLLDRHVHELPSPRPFVTSPPWSGLSVDGKLAPEPQRRLATAGKLHTVRRYDSLIFCRAQSRQHTGPKLGPRQDPHGSWRLRPPVSNDSRVL